MQSTFIGVVVLVLTGIFAGNAAGLAIKEYSLGAIENTLAGAIGGAAGYFLLAFIPPTVDAGGILSPILRSLTICSFSRLPESPQAAR